MNGGPLLDGFQPDFDFGERGGFDAGPFAPVDWLGGGGVSTRIGGGWSWIAFYGIGRGEGIANGGKEGRKELTPRKHANITQSEFVPDQVSRFPGGDVVCFTLGRETVIEHLVQALGFGLVAVDGVGDLLGGVC